MPGLVFPHRGDHAQDTPRALNETIIDMERQLELLPEAAYVFVDASGRLCRQKNLLRQRRLREEQELLEQFQRSGPVDSTTIRSSGAQRPVRHQALPTHSHRLRGSGPESSENVTPNQHDTVDSRVFVRGAMSYGTVLDAKVGSRRIRLDDGSVSSHRPSELDPVVEWHGTGDDMMRTLAFVALQYDEPGSSSSSSGAVARDTKGGEGSTGVSAYRQRVMALEDHKLRPIDPATEVSKLIGKRVAVFSPRITIQGRHSKVLGEKHGGWLEVRFVDDHSLGNFRKCVARRVVPNSGIPRFFSNLDANAVMN